MQQQQAIGRNGVCQHWNKLTNSAVAAPGLGANKTAHGDTILLVLTETPSSFLPQGIAIPIVSIVLAKSETIGQVRFLKTIQTMHIISTSPRTSIV
jgi:hypothetical protein